MPKWAATGCPVDLLDRVFIERSYARMAVLRKVDFRRRREVLLPEHFDSLIECGPLTLESVFRRIMEVLGSRGGEWHAEANALPGQLQDRWHEAYFSAVDHGWCSPDNPDFEYAMIAHLIRTLISTLFQYEVPFCRGVTDQEFSVDLYSVQIGTALYSVGHGISNEHLDSHSQDRLYSWRSACSVVEYGYALAVDTWLRREPLPQWRELLPYDARVVFERGLQHLETAGSPLLNRDAANPFRLIVEAELLPELLRSTDVAQLLNALTAVQESPSGDRETLLATAECLHDKRPVVQAAACYAAAAMGFHAASLFKYVVRLVQSSNEQVRIAAVRALPSIPGPTDEIAENLSRAAEDEEWVIAFAAIQGLLATPECFDLGVQFNLRYLQRALHRADCRRAQDLLSALGKCMKDVATFVRRELRDLLDDDSQALLSLELADFSQRRTSPIV